MTWVAVNDTQVVTWGDAATFGYLLLETGIGNYLTQEAGATLNRFIINTPLPGAGWSNINDSQGATWTPVNDAQ